MVYEPGELGRVREKLGDIDEIEAKRMAQILGGEVGREKTSAPPPKKSAPVSRRNVELVIPGKSGRRSGRQVDVASEAEIEGMKEFFPPPPKADSADDPSIRLNTSYWERIKMDRYASQFQFEIKSSFQVLVSMLTFFGQSADYVNPRFITRRVDFYYRKIELLVMSTRVLFPRHNVQRSERIKKSSPFVYAVLDTIRQWNTESLAAELARIQSHPRAVKVSEFAEFLRAVYKPLFILEKLDMDRHIKTAYKLLYKVLCVEKAAEPKDKSQDQIRAALASFLDIRREVSFGLYPLLMKHISDRWLPYERIFNERRRRLMAFLGITEEGQIQPVDFNSEQAEYGIIEAMQEEANKEESGEAGENEAEEDPDDPKVIERKAREAAAEAEKKALGRSLGVLEMLFPQAGWEKLSEYPDLHPYFANLYGLRRGYELIAPTDPLQQVAVLMHIMEDLFFSMRYVSFGSVVGADGASFRTDDTIGNTIANWRRYIDLSFTKEYLPRLSDYCRMLEHSVEARTSPFARRTLNELRWSKRLYFFPYYKFESIGPPPFQKQDIAAIYSEVRNLRKCLTQIAAGIDEGNRNGGAEARAACEGINNPWASYNFEVSNPVSKRLDALLSPAKRNNAAVVFFALSVATVLDHLLNNDSSWAYGDTSGVLFRSANNDGVTPMFGVDHKIDADLLFKDSLRKKMQAQAANKGNMQ